MIVTMKHQWILPILCVLSMAFWACSSPTSPTDSPKPSDPSGAVDPANPTNPVNPSNPANPTDPADPSDPSAPNAPGAKAIFYHGNGNTKGTTLVSENHNGQDPVTVKDRGDLYRIGYAFKGWNTAADGTGTDFVPGAELDTDEKTLKLYAKWEEVFPYISAGDKFSTLITKSGKLYSAGDNTGGKLGIGNNIMQKKFTAVVGNASGKIKTAASGTDHSFAILDDGNIAGWGIGEGGKLGNNAALGIFNLPVRPLYTTDGYSSALLKVAAISAGRFQTAILTDNGEYWAAGYRASGSLGNSGIPIQATFEKVGDNIRSVSAGEYYVMAVKNDGTLYASGLGRFGRTGTTANTTKGLTLNKEAGSDNAMVFAGKVNHTMLLKNDGRLLAAGFNGFGQLGVGNTRNQTSFKSVVDSTGTPLTDVALVSLGESHSMILRNDGTLLAVGSNETSQLGIDGTSRNKAVVVLENVARVAAGYDHTLAVTEDGKLWAAGSNQRGQFGDIPGKPGHYYTWIEIDICSLD